MPVATAAVPVFKKLRRVVMTISFLSLSLQIFNHLRGSGGGGSAMLFSRHQTPQAAILTRLSGYFGAATQALNQIECPVLSGYTACKEFSCGCPKSLVFKKWQPPRIRRKSPAQTAEYPFS